MTLPSPEHTPELPRDQVLARVREALLQARPDIAGIIVFGSLARGETWRDVDVLVVLDSLGAEQSAWLKEAIALRQVIDLQRVEVIPYSLRGFVNGLRNHSLFLLDIAVDGIILHDRAELSKEIAETRRYIQEGGIRRSRPGSWRFPVQFRRSTLLSRRSNQDYVRRWLDDAERDAEAATALRAAGLHDRSVYHCQQAVERAVKACLACLGAFERTHFVARALRQAVVESPVGEWTDRLARVADTAERLEAHVSRARYMIEDDAGEIVWVPAENYFDADSEQALQDAREALRVAREFAAWWFGAEG